MAKKIYIDLGANNGNTIASFLETNPDHETWGFEANPTLVEALTTRFANTATTIINAAAWVRNGRMPMYLGHPLSGTLLRGKKKMPQAPHFEIDYQTTAVVETIDFSEWLQNNAKPEDHVVVKMDIEGAEYRVLEHLLATGAVDLIDELRCEFHQNRFPVSKERDERVRAAISAKTNLVHWS